MEGLKEQLLSITGNLSLFGPEIVLVSGILALLFTGLFIKQDGPLKISSVLLLITAIVLSAVQQPHINVRLFNDMLRLEGLGVYLKILVDVAGVLTCLMPFHNNKRHLSEYYALLLTVILGGHLLLMSTNLIMVFLSLEMISIGSYVLTGYSFNKPSSEGSLKYFLFGAVASGIMLYGFTLLYGIAGTFDYTSQDFFQRLISHQSPMLLIAGSMSLGGFLYKIAAVPMHPWAPDVYESAPTRIVAFLSTAPKLAGLGILVKFVLALHLFGQSLYDWQTIISCISILTITVGNFSALYQKDPKRMMAYSSIAQTGFLLVGVAAFLPQGIQFMLFYAAIYLLMNFAVFYCLNHLEQVGIQQIADHKGIGNKMPWISILLLIALISLTGLPPTGGFTAKLFIFSALWESYELTQKDILLWLMILGLLNTVVSLFYYLRMPYFAFIKRSETAQNQNIITKPNLLAVIMVVVILVMFFLPGILMGWINRFNFVF